MLLGRPFQKSLLGPLVDCHPLLSTATAIKFSASLPKFIKDIISVVVKVQMESKNSPSPFEYPTPPPVFCTHLHARISKLLTEPHAQT